MVFVVDGAFGHHVEAANGVFVEELGDLCYLLSNV